MPCFLELTCSPVPLKDGGAELKDVAADLARIGGSPTAVVDQYARGDLRQSGGRT
jgi:hypothetical protein